MSSCSSWINSYWKVQKTSGHTVDRRAACLLAAFACLCADAAVLVLARMVLALGAAHPARVRTRPQNAHDHLLVRAGPSRGDAASSGANVCAVQVQTDALRKVLHLAFSETGIGAGCAYLGAGVAFLDAVDERVVRAPLDMRMRSDHLSGAKHGGLLSCRKVA